jgi:NAD(P)-dependent dehydrogenase (short-subunit alcohol dehydrogenase family)
VAVVTGGARGIGRASAILFAKEGAKVTVADNRSDLGQETVRLIEDAGGQAHFLLTDVADETQVKAMADDVVPHMRRQRAGVILNTASINSLIGQFKLPVYTASKGAVLLLTKSLALDYAGDNIRVNCICPGITDTPMLREHIEASSDPAAVIRERRARVPLGRFLTPQDIARAALYLASDESDGVTGIAHVVDGGLIAGADYNANWVSGEPQ